MPDKGGVLPTARRPVLHSEVIWSVLITTGLIFLVIEGLGLQEAVVETGAIHLIAIFYLMLAAGKLFSPRITGDNDFRPLGYMTICALLVLAVAHGFEYVAEVLITLPEGSEAVIMISLYAFALSMMTISIDRMLRKGGIAIDHISSIAKGLLVVTALITFMTFYPFGPIRLTPNGLSTSLLVTMLGLLTLLVTTLLRRLYRRFPVLGPFGRTVSAAIFLIFVSILPEAFNKWLALYGVGEHRAELGAHYLFYSALAIFYISFEKMRYFGGVYAEIDQVIEDAEQSAE